MTAAERTDGADAAAQAVADVDGLLASLRAAGADRFDPVRLHYIDALQKRVSHHDGAVKRLLEARLAKAVSVFGQRFEDARCAAAKLVAGSQPHHPHAAADLQRLFDAGDFRGVSRLAASLAGGRQAASLSELVRRLEPRTGEQAGARSVISAESSIELKTVRESRHIWSRLSVDRQVSQALAQAPKNAGPINSHMLVLRSLALMREISPDYLACFMAYAETLLCLEERDKEKPAAPKKQPASRAAKK